MDQQLWCLQMLREVEDSHGFYDLVAKYAEQFCHNPVITQVEEPHYRNGRLIGRIKGQRLKNNIFPFHYTLLFLAKHEEKLHIWNHLLDWLHWNSEVT